MARIRALQMDDVRAVVPRSTFFRPAGYHEKHRGGLIRPEAEEQKIVGALAMTLEVDATPIAAVFDAALATGDFHQNSPHHLRGGVVRRRPVRFLAGDRLTKASLVASSYQWIAICHS